MRTQEESRPPALLLQRVGMVDRDQLVLLAMQNEGGARHLVDTAQVVELLG